MRAIGVGRWRSKVRSGPTAGDQASVYGRQLPARRSIGCNAAPHVCRGARPDVSCRRSDYLRVGLFALLLFGYAAFSGRPLTMHEARLPETSREMLATRPLAAAEQRRPGRGWNGRRCRTGWWPPRWRSRAGWIAVWVVRLPSAAMGTATVLLTDVDRPAGCLGRTVGVLASGLALATSASSSTSTPARPRTTSTWRRSWPAAMALFVRGERTDDPVDDAPRSVGAPDVHPGLPSASSAALARRLLGNRPWHLWLFFALDRPVQPGRKGPLLGAGVHRQRPIGRVRCCGTAWRPATVGRAARAVRLGMGMAAGDRR